MQPVPARHHYSAPPACTSSPEQVNAGHGGQTSITSSGYANYRGTGYFAARTPHVNPDDTVRLYRAAALLADAEPLVSLDDPRVLTDVLEHVDGRRFAIAVSEADEPLTRSVRVPDARLRPSGADGKPLDTITLDPYGVALVHLRASRCLRGRRRSRAQVPPKAPGG